MTLNSLQLIQIDCAIGFVVAHCFSFALVVLCVGGMPAASLLSITRAHTNRLRDHLSLPSTKNVLEQENYSLVLYLFMIAVSDLSEWREKYASTYLLQLIHLLLVVVLSCVVS